MEEMEVQELEADQVGRRMVVLRQRTARHTEAGGKMLLEVPGDRFQALVTNLPQSMKPLAAWHGYNGRAEIENRIQELGDPFGGKRIARRGSWATEALHPMAITAYNLRVLLQRRLGQEVHV